MKNENLKLRGTKLYLLYPTEKNLFELTTLNLASVKLHRGLVRPPTDEKTFTDYLKRNDDEANESFFICEMMSGKIAGAINLSQIFRRTFQNCYLGYYIGAKFAGSGLMTEAVGLIIKYAFVNLKMHRVEANVQPHNPASIAVLRKNNFTKEGFSRKYLKIGESWRDHER